MASEVKSTYCDFNPRSPHGERPQPPLQRFCRPRYFNPRSPHGERPPHARHDGNADGHFNPRSPHGERQTFSNQAGFHGNFNPRSPHGERQLTIVSRKEQPIFQPTLPARGATRAADPAPGTATHFNPRSPHGERLRRWAFARLQNLYFNPRSPHGERRPTTPSAMCGCYFNPRSPHGERRTCLLLE